MICGLLLWLVIPVSTVGWLLAFLSLHRRRVTLGQFLGWVDLNLAALPDPKRLAAAVPRSAIVGAGSLVAQVIHRVDLLDFM